jgi:hypothetical protein
MFQPTTINVEAYKCPPEVIPRLRLLKHAWLCHSHVRGRDVQITFAANVRCDTHLSQILKILDVLLPQTKCQANPIRIAILLSDHKKVLPLPPTVLDPTTINTGYARRCGNIVVYREEEWRKVFIHECFHFFEFDAGITESIDTLFRLPVKVDLRETFCEVWARILNCVFTSALEPCLKRERAWGCFQVVKVLDYMGLSYNDLLRGIHLDRYQEHTNVFAYIVLGAILMQDPRAFMTWSGGFNAPSGLVDLLRSLYQTPEFLADIASAERKYARVKGKTIEARSLRMSVS